MGFNQDPVMITANDFFFGAFYQSLHAAAIDKNAAAMNLMEEAR